MRREIIGPKCMIPYPIKMTGIIHHYPTQILEKWLIKYFRKRNWNQITPWLIRSVHKETRVEILSKSLEFDNKWRRKQYKRKSQKIDNKQHRKQSDWKSHKLDNRWRRTQLKQSDREWCISPICGRFSRNFSPKLIEQADYWNQTWLSPCVGSY